MFDLIKHEEYLASDSCKVFCKTKDGTKSRSWIFPDGTLCHNENSDIDDSYFCVSGNCEVITQKTYANSLIKLMNFIRNLHVKTQRKTIIVLTLHSAPKV